MSGSITASASTSTLNSCSISSNTEKNPELARMIEKMTKVLASFPSLQLQALPRRVYLLSGSSSYSLDDLVEKILKPIGKDSTVYLPGIWKKKVNQDYVLKLFSPEEMQQFIEAEI